MAERRFPPPWSLITRQAPSTPTRFSGFLINLLHRESHIQSAENLSDRSLEDIMITVLVFQD
jgi:hypothetical protein